MPTLVLLIHVVYFYGQVYAAGRCSINLPNPNGVTQSLKPIPGTARIQLRSTHRAVTLHFPGRSQAESAGLLAAVGIRPNQSLLLQRLAITLLVVSA